jgi:hypothetical protein
LKTGTVIDMSASIRPWSRQVGGAALAALMTLPMLVGCGGGDVSTPSPSPFASEGIGSAAPSSETTAPLPADPGTPPSIAPTDELPYDPIQRTVTGVVERQGGCTVLVVEQSRFVLVGDLAASLTVGSRMTVTGNLTHRPPSCQVPGAQELQVTSARPA